MLSTTGLSPTQLASVVVGVNPPTGATPPIEPNVEVSLFSVSGGAPDTVLTTTGVVEVDMQATQGLYTFFDASSFSLAASTSYALVVSSDASGIKWGRNQNTTPTASSGFRYDEFQQSLNGGGTWSNTSISMDNAVAIQPLSRAGRGLARIGGREHAAHGPLISSVIVAAVPLAGLSFGFAYNMLGLSVRGVSDGGTFSCWKNGLGTENRPANWWTLRC